MGVFDLSELMFAAAGAITINGINWAMTAGAMTICCPISKKRSIKSAALASITASTAH